VQFGCSQLPTYVPTAMLDFAPPPSQALASRQPVITKINQSSSDKRASIIPGVQPTSVLAAKVHFGCSSFPPLAAIGNCSSLAIVAPFSSWTRTKANPAQLENRIVIIHADIQLNKLSPLATTWHTLKGVDKGGQLLLT